MFTSFETKVLTYIIFFQDSCIIAWLGRLSNLLSHQYQQTSATKRDPDIRNCAHKKHIFYTHCFHPTLLTAGVQVGFDRKSD